jgi:hypothetical protein
MLINRTTEGLILTKGHNKVSKLVMEVTVYFDIYGIDILTFILSNNKFTSIMNSLNMTHAVNTNVNSFRGCTPIIKFVN